MRQDVNLLVTQTWRVNDSRPVARRFLAAWLALVAIGVAVGVGLDYRTSTLSRAVAAHNLAVDDLMTELEDQSLMLAERDADPALVQELKRLQQEAEDKARVLTLLNGESVGNMDGFSGQLAALGRRHPDGLWLDRIDIGEGGRDVGLRGLTLDAGLVPTFLSRLQLEPVFAGVGFTAFTLESDAKDGGPLHFAIATDCQSTVLPDGATTCQAADGTGGSP